jgi:hypothetical protein
MLDIRARGVALVKDPEVKVHDCQKENKETNEDNNNKNLSLLRPAWAKS